MLWVRSAGRLQRGGGAAFNGWCCCWAVQQAELGCGLVASYEPLPARPCLLALGVRSLTVPVAAQGLTGPPLVPALLQEVRGLGRFWTAAATSKGNLSPRWPCGERVRGP